jgi:glycosyltransferase involved in cell wall biosynthesis
LHERKGQKYLIEAAKMLAEKSCNDAQGGSEARSANFKIVFIGEGPAMAYYKKIARPLGEKVVFWGRKKNVAEAMAAADLFVLPSIREAFGLVILEAAVAGLPIIATNTGGIPEIIKNGVSGILVPPADAQALASAIETVMQNDGLAKKMAKEAKDVVLEKFDARLMAAKTAELYDKLNN